MQSWREFWDGDHAIYANDRHKQVHDHVIMDDLLATFPQKNAVILDFGCGEALNIERMAAHAKALTLCDGATSIVEQLRLRFSSSDVKVILPEQLEAEPAGSYDVIIACSVIQYLSLEELKQRLLDFHRLLKIDGQLLIADIISPETGIVQDAFSLLKMAFRYQFFISACWSLIKTALSPYRRLRENLGFMRLKPVEIITILNENEFIGERLKRNIGAHQHRYSIMAQKKRPV